MGEVQDEWVGEWDDRSNIRARGRRDTHSAYRPRPVACAPSGCQAGWPEPSTCAICRSTGSGAAAQTSAPRRNATGVSHPPSRAFLSTAISIASPALRRVAGGSTMQLSGRSAGQVGARPARTCSGGAIWWRVRSRRDFRDCFAVEVSERGAGRFARGSDQGGRTSTYSADALRHCERATARPEELAWRRFEAHEIVLGARHDDLYHRVAGVPDAHASLAVIRVAAGAEHG